MHLGTLLSSFFVLVILLGILVVWLIILSKRKKEALKQTQELQSKPHVHKPKPPFSSLHDLLRDRSTSQSRLKKAVEEIIEDYGHIGRNLEDYEDMMVQLCSHPNVNKDLVLYFEKELSRLNPKYKKEINDAMTKGLDLR